MDADVMDKPTKRVRSARGSSRATHAYSEIRRSIIDLSFQPGQQLQESFLAQLLGMSRTPIREALHRLEGDGLIESVSSGGAVVAQVSVDDVDNAYYVIEVNEGLASRLAALRMGADGASSLRACLDRLEAATMAGDFDAWEVIDAEFHEAIRAIARNPQLNQVAHVIYPIIERIRGMYLRDGHGTEKLAEAMAHHRELGDAILAGDGDAADALARDLFMKAHHDNVRLLRRWVTPLRRSF
jgi:GntR family transcriptional regulator, rspAB operon transcriptional repressor